MALLQEKGASIPAFSAASRMVSDPTWIECSFPSSSMMTSAMVLNSESKPVWVVIVCSAFDRFDPAEVRTLKGD